MPGFPLSNQSEMNATNNQTNRGIGSSEKYNELDIFKIIFETIIALLGVFGNIAVCAVVTKNKKKRSSTEILLRNLAIADLGVLMVIFPLAVVKEKLPFNWPFGSFSCLYLYPVSETFYGVSVWTIVGIAVERYRHLFNPVKRGRQRAIKVAKRICFVTWLGSFLVFSAPIFFWIEYKDEDHIICYLKSKDPRMMEAYLLMLLFLWYIVPVMLIFWTYFAISRQLHKSNIFLKTMNRSDSFSPEMSDGPRHSKYSGTQERRLRQNKRVKKILTPVVVAFSITMMPVNIFRIVVRYYPAIPNTPLYPLCIYLVVLCVVINSSINPIIYCFVSRGFRAGMLSLIKRRSMGFSIVGSGVRTIKERINLKIRRSKLFSIEGDRNLELKPAGSASPGLAGKCDSQQTLPD